MNNQTKDALDSSTIVSAIVTIVVAIAGAVGYALSPEDVGMITVTLTMIGTFIGQAFVIKGRLNATKRIAQ